MAMASGKKTLVTMLIVFIAPILIGTIMFLNAENLGLSTKTVNYGTLVQPPVSLNAKGLSVANQPADIEQTLRNKWTLLYLAPNSCTEQCKARLALMKRIRLLTNEDMRRMRTLTLSSSVNPQLNTLLANYPKMMQASLNLQDPHFSSQLPAKDQHPIYVIDPLGNLMMYYSDESPDVKRIMKDFKRILKYSQIG